MSGCRTLGSSSGSGRKTISLREPASRRVKSLLVLSAVAEKEGIDATPEEIDAEVDAAVRDVNTRFGTRKWRPVHYVKRHHDHREIWPFYRHADFCLVTSLHDGMNLVAKEFVSVRDDDDGVLILSQFTGASWELRDSLLVNPYDLDGMADAVRAAVEMPPDERHARMGRLREQVREHNIYRWAGLLLSELQRIPEEAPGAYNHVLIPREGER